MRPGFYFKLMMLASVWAVWYLVADQVAQIEPIQSFDPYAILGVTEEAEVKDIKRAYRRLSIKMHPDKNPDDPSAVATFIQITKAYSALTDETAKENFKKYGNPDGAGSYQVAIAMPRFLLNKDY